MFNDLNCSSSSFLIDQNDPFESALSSMVSSPTASNNNGENIVLRELIGRLGSICNSANTSCYTTPLNSPPKGNHFLSLPTLSSDPAFADRAARLSCFSAKKSTTVQENWENTNSRENSMVSDQIFPAAPNYRKRKSSAPKGKAKEATPAPNISENSESSAKRSKSEEEPPKDYIHVRARRGQATDAHSLAERVRREKISERMKVLQDLVPGCNKVTGKAVMLDEIINYVQSLQRQVEFLSMKLATVNPRMEGQVGKLDMFQSRGSVYPPDSYPFQSPEGPNNLNPPPPAAAAGRMDSFGDAASQVSSFWEDDLHSIVQMGFGQSIQGIQMKVEL